MANEYDALVEANEYDALIDQDAGRQALRASMVPALASKPDAFAEARRLADQVGAPAEVVERNLEQVRRTAQINEYDRLLSDSPALARELTDKPDFAKVAHDDTGALAEIEQHARTLGRGAMNTPGEILKGFAGGANALAETVNLAGAGLIRLLTQSRAPGADPAAATDWWFENMVEPLRKANEAFVPGGGLAGGEQGNLYEQVVNALGGAGFTLVEALLTGGEAPALRAGAALAETLGGAVEHGIKGMSLPALSSAVERGRAVYDSTSDPLAAVRAAVAQFEASAIQGILPLSAPGTVVSRVVQGAVSGAVSGEVGKQVADAGLPPELRQPITRDERLLNAITGAVLGIGGPRKAQAAIQDAKALTRLAELATASKTAQRDPAAFQAFVDAAAAEGPVRDVYVSGRTLIETLNQGGVPADEFARRAPVAAAQLGEALASGGDVRIPLGEYATAIAATDLNAGLLPHLKTDPAGLSQAEAEVFMQAQAQDLKATAEQVLAEGKEVDAFRESAGKVESVVLEQLSAANRFTKDVNRGYAVLTRDFYAAAAAREGVTPEELFKRFPLRVVAEDIAAGEKLDQGALSPLGQRVQELRALGDKATPEQRAELRDLLERGAGLLAPAQARAEPALFQGARGAFDRSSNTIALLKDADLSTFLHESGHFYLETLVHLADRPDSPFAGDVQKLLDWFGVKDLATWRGMTLEQQRAHHEKFARGFEAFLFEGKAPSVELRGLFARFRAWLVNVYRSLASLDVELTDEVRGVFGRLLATEEQIREAEALAGARPLFKEAAEAGMTAEEWNRYQALGTEATTQAVAELQARSMRDMQWLTNARSRELKKLQREAEAKRRALRDEVTAEVRQMPIYAVQRFLSHGELPEAAGRTGAQRDVILEAGMSGTKLSLPALKEMYGEGPAAPWRYLKTGSHGLAAEQGLHPDLVAKLFGYTSGDHLVREILGAEPEASAIEGLTDRRMLERHGDVATPDALARAANEAVHNDARMRFVASELNALAKATGGRKVLAGAAREFAEQIVARKRVREIKPGQYTAAEARAARAAEKAVKAGNLTEAAVEKRNQLINGYASRAATAALEEVEKGVRYLKRFAAPTRLDPEYAEQISTLLARFDLRRISDKEADRRASLAEWVKSQEEQGFSPIVPEELLDEANRKPYREMSLEEFRGLVDTVRNIEHLGRLKHKLLTAADQREFEAIRDDVANSIETNATGTIAERRSSDRSPLVRAAALFRSARAVHRKFASLTRQFDGWKDGGATWEYLTRAMNQRGAYEASHNEKATVALSKLLDGVTGGKGEKLTHQVYFPEIGKSFSREERIGIALNMGNEINRERVLSGERLTAAQLGQILGTLEKRDLEFVQGVWDFIGSYRDEIAAKERRVTGVEPDWVEASLAPELAAAAERHGVALKGGYFPIAYDPLRSSRSAADVNAETIKQAMQGLYTRAQTRRGHLKARAESTGRPLRYDFAQVITKHVSQVIHDLAWHEYLIDANRLLGSERIGDAVRQHYGPEVLTELKDTLRDIAIGDMGVEKGAAFFNHLRYGTTIGGLGFNVVNSIVNLSGITQSMVRIGPQWVVRGMAHWFGDAGSAEGALAKIYAKSETMRLRGKTFQREINDIRNRVSGKDSRIQAAYFWLQNRTQLLVDVPTWWGAYEKAMAAEDMTEARAIELADQAVLDAQGGGQTKDLAGIQRGHSGLKLFTTFYSFFNTTFNLTAESFGRTDFRKPKDVLLFAADMALLYTIPALAGTLLKTTLQGAWEDEDKLAKRIVADQISYMLGTVVLLREATAGVQAAAGVDPGLGYTGPASVRFFADLYKLGQQAGQAEVDAAFLKSLNNVGGVLFHYPSGQINRTVEGAFALADGRSDNPGVILTGPPPK